MSNGGDQAGAGRERSPAWCASRRGADENRTHYLALAGSGRRPAVRPVANGVRGVGTRRWRARWNLQLAHRMCARQQDAGLRAHVCLPGFCVTTSQPGLCFTTSQPGLRFTTSLPGPVAFMTPTTSLTRSVCRAGRSSQPDPTDVRTTTVWHLFLRSKPATLPTATRPRPDRLDNPNRPVSILSNSEPALCALAPAPDHQATSAPARSH